MGSFLYRLEQEGGTPADPSAASHIRPRLPARAIWWMLARTAPVPSIERARLDLALPRQGGGVLPNHTLAPGL